MTLCARIAPVFFLFIANFAFSQNWGVSIGGSSVVDQAKQIALDGSGNVYAVGSNYPDGYLDKYNPANGSIVWHINLTGGNTFVQAVTYASNYIYISGTFAGTVNFNPLGTASSQTATSISVFVAKYNSSGVLIWSMMLPSSGSPGNEVTSIEVDKGGSNRIYVSGRYYGTLDFDSGPGTVSRSSNGPTYDGFLFAYDQPTASTFSYKWVQTFGGTNGENAVRVVTDNSGNLYATGYFTDQNINIAGKIVSASGPGVSSMFFGQFNPITGSATWLKTVDNAFPTNMVFDFSLGFGLVITGTFNNSIDLDPGAGTMTFTSNGNTDFFVAEYLSVDIDPDVVFAGSGGSTGNDVVNALCVSGGKLYIGGVFYFAPDFDIFTNGVKTLSTGGQLAIFLAKYDMTNNQILGLNMVAAGATPTLNDLKFDNSNSQIFAAGAFAGSNIDFDPGTGTILLSSVSSAQDGFLVGYSESSVLPVQLSSLAAIVEQQSVKLNWQTSSEQNNKGFNIQRFVGNEWRTIGFVKGAGNSSQLQNYSYNDIPKASGVILYRLEQVDFDGKTTLSNVVKADMGKLVFKLNNYPNPASSITTLEYTLPNDETVNLKIYNAAGILLQTVISEKQKAGIYQYNINTQKLGKGNYIYELSTTSGIRRSGKILVQ